MSSPTGKEQEMKSDDKNKRVRLYCSCRGITQPLGQTNHQFLERILMIFAFFLQQNPSYG